MPRFLGLLLCVLTSPSAQVFPSYASGDGFRGVELMSPDERKVHVAKMQSFHSMEECLAYSAAHEVDL